ncbi:MAG: YraN family protein [Gemmatimonadales bacterium]|nr:MAG: YraN family protein [Gemmatimonadales bacterium]
MGSPRPSPHPEGDDGRVREDSTGAAHAAVAPWRVTVLPAWGRRAPAGARERRPWRVRGGLPRGDWMGRRMRTGRLGEELAARAMERNGWEILARCWRDGPREIDLVVARGGTLAFVEVKTRRTASLGETLAAVSPAKRRDVERAAAAWLRTEFPARSAASRFSRIRFDVVAVLLPPGEMPRIERVEGAWVRGDAPGRRGF